MAKAEESLASADADFAARRYNACARNAYYAAFQSAVAALIAAGVTPQRRWEHAYVQARFAGQLIKRSKLYSADMRDILKKNIELRHDADYTEVLVGRVSAQRALSRASALLSAVKGQIEWQ